VARSTSPQRAKPATLAKVPGHIWRLAIVIVLGSFMSTLDGSLINVGLNTICRSFHASLVNGQWLGSGYVVAFAAALPLTAWLSRRIGSGRLWLTALIGFTSASVLCSLAPNLPVLIALRVVQGLTGAMLVPTGQTIIGQAAGPERMGRVLNVTKIVVVLAPAVGPSIGGLLISELSWRWLFLVNVPIGALAMLLGLRLVPRGTATRGRPFDFLGFLLIAAGLPLLVYGITAISRYHGITAAPALLTLPAGLIALGLAVVRCLAVAHPVLDLRLFTNRVYAAATASVFFTGAALLGALILLPLYYQLLRHADVIQTGLLMLAVGGGTALSMPFGGLLTDRIGGGLISVVGLLVSAASILPMAFLPANASLVILEALQLVTGFGLGLAAMPALSVAYKTVPRDRLPDATSEANIIQRIGGSTGTALLVVLLGNAPGVTAFHTTFFWLTGSCVIALGLASWLMVEEGRRRRAPRPGPAAELASTTTAPPATLSPNPPA
jgi:EmrB/QacA subfamily drug resistance transporter